MSAEYERMTQWIVQNNNRFFVRIIDFIEYKHISADIAMIHFWES